MDLIVSLYRIECFQEECNRMQGMILTRLLGENCSSSNARAVGFKSKWEIVVMEYQDRG
jgi:hypothetical protein